MRPPSAPNAHDALYSGGYLATSRRTVFTFRSVGGIPSVFSSLGPENGESLEFTRQRQ